FQIKHGSFDPICESVPRIELNVFPTLAVQANVDDHDTGKRCDKAEKAFKYARAIMFSDDSIRNASSTIHEAI
ncbi:MAG: hypothetical protein ACRD3J_30075, partial [Thermoanaerobaculia bacterium]